MADLRKCEFYVLRYVPNVVKGEFVNIGVVLLEAGESDAAYSDVRLTRDWRRVRCVDPEVDIGLLQAVEQELRSKLQSRAPEAINYKGPVSRREWLLDQIETSWAGALQMAPVMGVLTESPEVEMGVLATAYLESQARGKQERAVRGRMAIYNAMRGAFEEAAVWALMQKDIPAAEFTRPGDPFTVDFGYQPNGVLHMLQAFSLAGQTGSAQVNAAKALAFSYRDLNEGLIRIRHVESDLTAIVEDGLDVNDPAVGFALATLAESDVQVARVNEMAAIAERVRAEMGL
jgi:Protein of unknown function (DUF3037)